MKRRQARLFKIDRNDIFGGVLLKGNPKTKRYIPRNLPMHITLKSDIAVGNRSMLLFQKQIRLLIEKHAQLTQGVRLYDFVNVGNHIHIMAQFHNRYAYQRFIRTISGLIARVVLGAQRGASKGLKFWTYRPYSRIVHAGKRCYEKINRYFALNRAQLLGVKRYKKVRGTGHDSQTKHTQATDDPVTGSFLEILKSWDPFIMEKILV